MTTIKRLFVAGAFWLAVKALRIFADGAHRGGYVPARAGQGPRIRQGDKPMHGAFWRALASRSRASGAAARTRHAENEPR